jgi:hypothetical protein
MADADQDGRMDLAEFVVAMHLITLKLKDEAIPDTLPSSWLPKINAALPGVEDKVSAVCAWGRGKQKVGGFFFT